MPQVKVMRVFVAGSLALVLIAALAASGLSAELADAGRLYAETRVEMRAQVPEEVSATPGQRAVQAVAAPSGWVKATAKRSAVPRDLSSYERVEKVAVAVDGRAADPAGPALAKGDDVWLPVAQVAKRLGMIFMDLGKGRYSLIRHDGVPVTVEEGAVAALVNGQPYMDLTSPPASYEGNLIADRATISQLFSVTESYDPSARSVSFTKSFGGKDFTVYEVAKPQTEKEKAPEAPPIVVIPERLGRIGPTPPDIAPDMRIVATDNMVYQHTNLTKKRERWNELSVAGDIYRYRTSLYLKHEDQDAGTLVNTSKYFGIYGNDVWIRTLDLTDSLYPLRSQYENYEGLEVKTFHDNLTSRYWGGRRELNVPIPGPVGSAKYQGQLGGLSQYYKAGLVDLGGSLIGMQNRTQTLETRGLTGMPKRNILYYGESTVHLPYKLDVSGQAAVCNYNPDNRKDALVQDKDWRVEAKLNREMLSLGYIYEFVGADYASYGFLDNYRNYKESRYLATYRPARFLSLQTAYTINQNNVDDIDSLPTQTGQSVTASATMTTPGNSTLTFSTLYGKSITDGPSLETTGSISKDYRVDYYKNWEDVLLQLSYDRYGSNSVDSDNDFVQHIYSASIYKFLRPMRGSFFRARQDITKTKYRQFGMATTLEYFTTLGARYYLTNNLYIYGDWVVKTTTKERFADTAIMTVTAGSQWIVCRELTLGVDFQFNPFDLYRASGQNSRDWNITFRVIPTAEYLSPDKWAKIEGYVYNDTNGNGAKDVGEPGIPHVLITIPKENAVRTDKTGRYYMKDVTEGKKTIKLDTKDLPIELAPVTGASATAEAVSRKTIRVDFPLVEYGSIRGRVYVDANGSGTYDVGEEGAEGVRVYLRPGDQWRETDENGKFVFDYIMPGDYELAVDVKRLRPSLMLKDSAPLKKHVGRGVKIADANITLIEKPIEVKIFK